MDVWGWLQSNGAPIWQGIERASWVIAITLLPLGLVQLWFVWREQKRIVQELSRKPDLRVGFFTPSGKLEDTVYVVTQWDANTKRSLPIELRISSHNVGTRSAHDALVTLTFPKDAQILSTECNIPARLDDASGGWRVWDKQPDVHPDVYTHHKTTVTAAESLRDGFDIGATISMDDYPTAKHLLKVKFLKAVERETKEAPVLPLR
jgi:hypothetical protein